MTAEHLFEQPDRFVVGTVGRPGERVFYLQAIEGPQTVTVALEKAEVAALAQGLSELLTQVGAKSRRSAEVDPDPLQTPFLEDFRVSELSVSWDGERVVIEAADGSAGRLKVSLTTGQTQAFVGRAQRIVAAGRPPCTLCGRPDGPDGHFCPRLN
jgi:uncharacterized repeat protein (TIGR03847 family)